MKSLSIRLIIALLVFCLAPACAPDAQNADPKTDEISKPDAQTSDKSDDSSDSVEDEAEDEIIPEDTSGQDDDNQEESPYADLNNRALRDALRATHRDHRAMGYSGSRNARDFLFNYEIEHEGPSGQIECIYTGRTAMVDSRRDAQNQQPMWNTEHTWPQSRGASSEPQKSDLHHLFVVDAEINGLRGNHRFGDVTDVEYSEGGSKLGSDSAGQTRFEVRDMSKGNIARAVLYFSVAYDLAIDADEEATMRRWHAADPVDDAERARNDAIETAQKSRNFFIDWPELVAQIDNF